MCDTGWVFGIVCSCNVLRFNMYGWCILIKKQFVLHVRRKQYPVSVPQNLTENVSMTIFSLKGFSNFVKSFLASGFLQYGYSCIQDCLKRKSTNLTRTGFSVSKDKLVMKAEKLSFVLFAYSDVHA